MTHLFILFCFFSHSTQIGLENLLYSGLCAEQQGHKNKEDSPLSERAQSRCMKRNRMPAKYGRSRSSVLCEPDTERPVQSRGVRRGAFLEEVRGA